MSKQIFGAQLSLRCCGPTFPDRTAGPCWQLYVAMSGLVSEWPTFNWPTTTEVPSIEARKAALAYLGFVLDEGAEWEWTELTGPDFHPHPVRVLLLGAVKLRRQLFPLRLAVEPAAPPLLGSPADPDRGDDGMGESWVWVPGDRDDEEADR